MTRLQTVVQSEEFGAKSSMPAASDRSIQSSADLAIVILNYNTATLLRDCLRSIQTSQHELRVEVIVVDNASSDESVAMVRSEFPDVRLMVNPANIGYSAGNNVALRALGFDPQNPSPPQALPRYVLLLNPDTILSPTTLAKMVRFMDDHPTIGVAGPRVRRPDGSLDRACRRSFPTPQVSFYRMTGLSRLFPKSRRFNAYNLEYLPEDSVHPVDSVVGAYMQVRREAILQAGLLDERFFMYGEDLDWAKRIKDAGWEIWYNGEVEITHVKEAASSQSSKSRIDFYEAMWLFYQKHYRRETNWALDKAILLGIVGKGALDVGRHLWRFCTRDRRLEDASSMQRVNVDGR
ncbi:glycosyltransferase family 2 protein [Caldilinea sp.]|uniref:glycosyltransferase family 2 protein n=1 Tax=Caldilinea sp. TaxID=2293560 RepID=UPI00260504F5|nr:glycosyltransferase family 2 protein [Caldilinea sp.]